MSDVKARELVSETPNDVQAPRMYERSTLFLFFLVLAGIVALATLAFTEHLTAETITALVAICSPAVTGLAGLFQRRVS